MKKLLLCAFALTHALALYSMHSGLGLIIKPDGALAKRRIGLTTRPTLSINTRTPFTAPVDHTTQEDQAEASKSPSAPAGLRSEIQPYSSWNRISVADQYPIDEGEDTWDIVTKHDAKEAAIMQTAQKVLLQAKSLVPEDLKPHIKTNIHESENPLKELETARELVWACLTRTAPTFATDYVETLTKNFGPCKQYDPAFDASKVYGYLKYDNEFAMKEPNETFAQLIKQNLDIAVAENDEKTQWFMRQFGFMFRDPATQQTYNAYLKGGKEALETLKIPEEKAEGLQACFDHIADAKYSLKELQKK